MLPQTASGDPSHREEREEWEDEPLRPWESRRTPGWQRGCRGGKCSQEAGVKEARETPVFMSWAVLELGMQMLEPLVACHRALGWAAGSQACSGNMFQVWRVGGRRPAFYCLSICSLLRLFLCRLEASFWIQQIQSLRGKQGSMAGVQKAHHKLP